MVDYFQRLKGGGGVMRRKEQCADGGVSQAEQGNGGFFEYRRENGRKVVLQEYRGGIRVDFRQLAILGLLNVIPHRW